MWVLICAYLDKLIGTSKIKQGAIMSHPMTHNPITQHKEIDDVNIEKIHSANYPKLPKKSELPLSELAYHTVLNGRKTIQNILDGIDKRILIVVGPCSIHDPVAAHEYADKLKVLSEELKNELFYCDACLL